VRPAWAEVDLGAVAHNVRAIDAMVGRSALCAVVKADGYGHGSVEVAKVALASGAESLAVALVEEGLRLRAAGIEAPILVLSEAPPAQVRDLVAGGLTPTVYTHEGIEAVAKAVAELEASGRRDPAAGPVAVQVKVDTGMHRVGAAPEHLLDLVRAIDPRPELRFGGLWSHCAVADEPDHPFTAEQLARFERATDTLRAAGFQPPQRHLANSAAAIAHPDARLDLVRCGIALYGLAPAPGLTGLVDLEPALALKSTVSFVHTVPRGEGSCYGLRRRFEHDATVATVPIGYADGVWRGYWEQGEVLIGGVRRRLAGTVTMDQIVVDCTDGPPVAAGDEVVLIGRQGTDEITAQHWADLLGTITYEIVCSIGARVPRRYVGGPSSRPEPDGSSS
jgi:alanine racemase